MTLRELIEAISYDDNGNAFDLDMPIAFHTNARQNMELLSVYENDGRIDVDID